MEYRICTLCPAAARFEDATDVNTVECDVREFKGQRFTVWRCTHCLSLHCLEPIDYERFYARYPVQRQKKDFVSNVFQKSRWRKLRGLGLSQTSTILDYGCGSGAFVEYLQGRGLVAMGYDPYSPRYSSTETLTKRYDLVTSQDVIEHVPDPLDYIDQLAARVTPGGLLAIGTPNAANVDLRDPLDAVGILHQPFHRHLFTGNHLSSLMAARGFDIVRVDNDWYWDTLVPYVNSNFLLRYLHATDRFMDSWFDPISAKTLLRNPSLHLYGLFGGFFNRGRQTLIVGRRR